MAHYLCQKTNNKTFHPWSAESPWSAVSADGVRALGAVGTDSVSADDVRTPSALTVPEHPAGGADLPHNSFQTTAP